MYPDPGWQTGIQQITTKDVLLGFWLHPEGGNAAGVLGAVSIHSCLLTFASVSRMPSAHLPCSVTDLSFRGSLPVVSAPVAFKNAQRVPTFAARGFKSIRTDNRDWSFNLIKNRLGLTTHTENKEIFLPCGGLSSSLVPFWGTSSTRQPIVQSHSLVEDWLYLDNYVVWIPRRGPYNLIWQKKAVYTFNVIPPIFKLHFSWKQNKQSYHLYGTTKNPE